MSRIEKALRRANQVPGDQLEDGRGSKPEPLLTLVNGAIQMPDFDVEADDPPMAATAVAEPPMAQPIPVAPPVVTAPPMAAAPAVASFSARTGAARSDKLVVTDGFNPIAAEQYRKLAAALHQVQAERGTRSVMVTSTLPGEGKTLTATNLAITLSESFKRNVLLIDADLRRPTVHLLFGAENGRGLNDELHAVEDRKVSLVEVSPRLKLLTGGQPNRDPMSALTSDRMRRIIEDATLKFDWVVLDTPPVMAMPDASLLGKMVDMTVLLVGAGMAPSRSIQRAIGLLDPGRIVGVVLNRVVESPAAWGYYGYGYHRPDASGLDRRS